MALQSAILGTARLNAFRLNYLSADVVAGRPVHVWIILGGVDITRPDAPVRVIYKSLTIRDQLYDAPNTCSLTLYGAAAPHVGQQLEVWINTDAPQLLFNGELQTVERTYKGQPSTVFHPVTAIDDTARANLKRPLVRYVNVSASTIAQDLITRYVPGFFATGVEANLPAVTINFDGSEGGMKGCLTALAKLVGGYWFFENKTLYFFITPPGTPPDPIDATPGRLLHEPAITWASDKSQVRTRVYGKGASTGIAASLNANESLVPIVNAEMFSAAGGQAIAGVTPDGAASRVLTYTGVQLGGGGGLVGPGAAPSAVPGLALLDGPPGIESGAHRYAYTFVTASGESLPGPVGTITVGATSAPVGAPVPGIPTVGGVIDDGTYTYAVTFVTASGETTSGPASASVTIPGLGGVVAPPATAPTNQLEPGASSSAAGAWAIGDAIAVAVAYVNTAGVTTIGPVSNSVTIVPLTINPSVPCPISMWGAPVSTDPTVTQKRVYIRRNGVWSAYTTHANNVTNTDVLNPSYAAGTPPATNTATVANARTVAITGIPIGPANVTARRLYRLNGGWYNLVATIANNTATTFTDTLATASLGPAMPGTNTAQANQVRVTVPLGGAGVTARKLYRSAANATPIQFLTTIANNTTTVFSDLIWDLDLGAAPPVTDTSGLTQPSGQVPAGSTSLMLANPAPFAAGGGWAVVGNGEQVIRYTGISATALTGIPATGPGAIVASISYNSTVTANPALVGVTGLLDAVIRNAPIHVWVQRDDLAAQAQMAALDGYGGDGVYEHIWSDERRTEASLRQVCDAQLKLYSRPMVTVTYASRDLKTKSGKTVTIALPSPAISESLTIQDVTISELGIRGLAPKFTVTASNVNQSFEAVLQMLIRKADA